MSIHKVTLSDNNTIVQAQVGDIIQLELPTLPTAGFVWVTDSDNRLCKYRSDCYETSNNTGIGAQSLYRPEFEVTHAGEELLSLKHWQPWEGDASVDNRFSIHLKITNEP